MTVLLIAGIGVILAGLAAIGFGIPVKEFGFGNTLILTGTVGICTGLIMISLALVVRELKKLVPQTLAVGAAPPLPSRELRLPPVAKHDDDDEDGAPPTPLRDGPAAPEPAVPPWQDVVLRDRERAAAAASGASEEPKRRNLMFSSTRREREAQGAEAAIAQALDLGPPEAAPVAPQVEEQPSDQRSFDAAWPQADRPAGDRPRFSDALRRAARSSVSGDRIPDASEIPDRDEPAPVPERAPGVTVLKSGVVDGMAYSLYSDGSIEAQMPEGLMRFASIDELREHLDSRS